MAARKSDSFIIRGQIFVPANEARYVGEIDLGSYVNLGVSSSTVLRVHSVQFQLCDASGLPPLVDGAATTGQSRTAYAAAAITTATVPQSMAATAMPQLNEDYVMYTSSVTSTNWNGDADQGLSSHDLDIAPQHLSAGYLVAVDTLYMYGSADDAWGEDVRMNFALECTLEKATQANSVSLALSQQ